MRPSYKAKQAKIDEIKDKISRAKSIVFINYKGLNVKETTELRVKMRENGMDFRVYKNRLVNRAFTELGVTGLEADLNDTLAVAFSYEDETAAARILKEVADSTKKTKLKFGFLGETKLDADKIKELASIPNKEVLLSKLLFVLKAPMQKLAIAVSKVAEQK